MNDISIELDSAIQRRCEWVGKPIEKIECRREVFDALVSQNEMLGARPLRIRPSEETFAGIPIVVNEDLSEPFILID